MKHYIISSLNIKPNNKENRPNDNVTKSGIMSGNSMEAVTIIYYYITGIASLPPPWQHAAIIVHHVTIHTNNAYQNIQINTL